MKLHYSKLLLFSLLLNILAHNKNKAYLKTRHTSTITSRVLNECDLYMPNYDDDAHMKSVKEIFDRQTSQRFEEYEERMITTRQKNKEQRDKDIQKIVLKDKMEKSLEEKIEKGCLKCGCGLGGVAAGIGIIGPIAISELKKAAAVAASQKGIQAGIAKAIEELGKIVELSEFKLIDWVSKINGTNFFKPNSLVAIVNEVYYMCDESIDAKGTLFCQAIEGLGNERNVNPVRIISQMAAKAAADAGEEASKITAGEITAANTASYNSYIAIAYSVLAILIILLVIVIIYLILRYRRKKKMNKKLQYTKLLNQ
ncbi:hypothetical protein PFBG_05947 [Plasmodium falciparum 7G8]|uniref:Rifin n=1 Tax=Plasmodium falciparum (isolate 7G8) TaxID=57266 RepID=W7F627_PLAF8|nr:hypothetical protein PFBG_05947 [Plasmodium falciparum 7G8]